MRLKKITPCFLLAIFIIMPGIIPASQAEPPQMPEPDPPFATVESPNSSKSHALSTKSAPTTEWTYHKTDDNTHPDGSEQEMIWLMNRARTNPSEEGVFLSTMDDEDVTAAIAYFNVDTDLLMDEFDAIDAKPPAAFDVRLYNAAKAHSDDLISRDAQDHDGQFDRVTAAGFTYSTIRGNVFSYARSAIYCHASFNIDWGGSDESGMQDGRGHRLAIMSIDGDYTNVGIAMVPETDDTTNVGPWVTTGNYAHANTGTADHYNMFMVGTVWEDENANNRYDHGEGLSGITIRPDAGTYYAVSADSGGYAIPMDAGTYNITFSGDSLGSDIVRSVIITDQSVLLDLVYSSADTGDSNNETSQDDTTQDDTTQDSTTQNDTTQDSTTQDDSTSSNGGGCFIGSVEQGISANFKKILPQEPREK